MKIFISEDQFSNKYLYDYKIVQAMLNSAKKLRSQDKYRDALVMLNEALEYDPGRAITLYYLGDTHRMLAEYEKAIDYLNHCTNKLLYENLSAAFSSRGASYRQLSEYKKAHEDLSSALKHNHKNYFALYERGIYCICRENIMILCMIFRIV